MKWIKDFIYDKNDIFIALIIVCVAAFVIFGRIDAIMAYPSSLSGEAVETAANGKVSKPADSGILTGDARNNAQTPSKADGQQADGTSSKNNADSQSKNDNKNSSKDRQSDKAEKYSVYITPGSTGEQIADLLISVGLMESRQQFLSAVTAAGAESKLKAGNYIIPSNATPAEVVTILTR